jgi:hypothetical protein
MNGDIIRILKSINHASTSLEIFSYSAVASVGGAYGAEDPDYTQRRTDDVLRMLAELEALHTDLKQAMGGV